jgi:hypothetical protein
MSGESELREVVHYLARVAVALERIADADELRNELLEADRAERRESWEAAELHQDERLRAIVVGLPSEQIFASDGGTGAEGGPR